MSREAENPDENMAVEDPSSNEPLDDQDSQEEIYIVDTIVDVKAFVKEKTLKYKVRWEGYSIDDDTWERADSLADSPLVVQNINEYREANKEKVEKEEAKLKSSPARPVRNRRRQTWEFVEVGEEPNRSDLTNPRELDKADEFYGEVAASIKGEAKKLFDPDHKNSATELLLSQVASTTRLTRRQVKELLPEDPPKNGSPTPTPSASAESSPAPSKIIATPARSVRSCSRRSWNSDDRSNNPAIPKKLANSVPAVPKPPTSTAEHSQQRISTPAKNKPVVAQISKVVEAAPVQPACVSPSCRKRSAVDSLSDTSSSPNDTSSSDSTVVLDANDNHEMPLDLPIHIGDIDLSSIRSEYEENMKKMTKELNPMDYRFGRQLVNLFNTNNNLKAFAVDDLFKKLSDPELQSIFDWREEGSGYSILHWLCVNLPCDSTHTADHITHILCTHLTSLDNSATQQLHVIDSIDLEANTPLHLAVQTEALCRVGVLLNHRARLNVVNNAMRTPLMIAYEKNNVKMVRQLLRAGADFHILLSALLKQPKENIHSKEALDEMVRHSELLKKVLIDSRKKVLGSLEEVQGYHSQVRLAHFQEGPVLRFELPHPHYDTPSADYMYMLALHVCNFDSSDVSQWTARCWGGLKQDSPPLFNGMDISEDRGHTIEHPMLYFVDPVLGGNTLDLSITPNELHYDILACQMFLVRPVPDLEP